LIDIQSFSFAGAGSSVFNLTDKRKRRGREGWGGGDYSREAIIFNISVKGGHFNIQGNITVLSPLSWDFISAEFVVRP